MSGKPADAYGLVRPRESSSPGRRADIVVFDPEGSVNEY